MDVSCPSGNTLRANAEAKNVVGADFTQLSDLENHINDNLLPPHTETRVTISVPAAGPLRGILDATDEELVSVDFNGNPHSSIVDLPSTALVDGNMVKVLAWYDNEYGYSSRVRDLIRFIGKTL